MDFKEALLDASSELGISLSPRQLEQSIRYAGLLRQWSEQLSLTTVKDAAELARFHFVEAFWGAEHFLESECRIADIGSGTGFPGMAVKIYRPDLRVALLERNTKKAVFLETLQSGLGLPVEVCRVSAEEWKGWDDVDLAMMRAVRPDRRLLKPLRARAIPLLYFQAADTALPAPWSSRKSLLYPFSNQRLVNLWEASVSRETLSGQPSP